MIPHKKSMDTYLSLFYDLTFCNVHNVHSDILLSKAWDLGLVAKEEQHNDL